MQSIETQVLANLLSTSLVLGIFWFLAKKYFGNLEARITQSENDAKALRERAHELEHNYVDRFEGVNKKQEENKEQVLKRIDEINTDKINFRMKQVEKMATIENKVDNLIQAVNRNGKN